MFAKLRLLKQCTDDLNMKIHPQKSLFMFCGKSNKDTQPFILDDITISHTDRYVYLGNIITEEPIAKHVSANLALKEKHIHKYASFLKNNANAPFWIKHRVLESALFSSVFYGCESWITPSLAAANKIHITAVKHLLGVRIQTNNIMVYAEADVPDAKSFIYKRQIDFLKKRMNRNDYHGSPLDKTLRIATSFNTPMAKQTNYLLALNENPVQTFKVELRQKLATAASSRVATYIAMNPNIESHAMYSKITSLQEYKRIAVTRIRLGSHRLKIETGRWSRTPRNERLCTCGSIQDEAHVLLECSLSQPMRDKYNIDSLNIAEFMDMDVDVLTSFVFDVLSFYCN